MIINNTDKDIQFTKYVYYDSSVDNTYNFTVKAGQVKVDLTVYPDQYFEVRFKELNYTIHIYKFGSSTDLIIQNDTDGIVLYANAYGTSFICHIVN